MISGAALGRVSGIRHGFFTRKGGVSEGVFASLNCGFGSGDQGERVGINRARAMERLGRDGATLVTAHQTHSAVATIVEEPWAPGEGPQADGMATRRPDVTLGVLTADCAPVLFADTDAGVVGAAHAGWRGARAGILEATVDAMIGLGARVHHIVADVGPCIQQPSYEVGPELRAAFVADDGRNANLFMSSDRAGHYLFDLPGYLHGRLAALGLKDVELVPMDTRSDEDHFFSYRRSVLRGEADYGRCLSAIGVAP